MNWYWTINNRLVFQAWIPNSKFYISVNVRWILLFVFVKNMRCFNSASLSDFISIILWWWRHSLTASSHTCSSWRKCFCRWRNRDLIGSTQPTIGRFPTSTLSRRLLNDWSWFNFDHIYWRRETSPHCSQRSAAVTQPKRLYSLWWIAFYKAADDKMLTTLITNGVHNRQSVTAIWIFHSELNI